MRTIELLPSGVPTGYNITPGLKQMAEECLPEGVATHTPILAIGTPEELGLARWEGSIIESIVSSAKYALITIDYLLRLPYLGDEVVLIPIIKHKIVPCAKDGEIADVGDMIKVTKDTLLCVEVLFQKM